MSRTTTGQLVVILEADQEDDSFDVVSVNGKTEEQCWDEKRVEEVTEGVFEKTGGERGGFETLRLLEVRKAKKESDRLTDEQAFFEEWSMGGTDFLWDANEPPAMQGKRYVKLTGYIWWEEYNSIDYGLEYDGGFEIESLDLLDELPGEQ